VLGRFKTILGTLRRSFSGQAEDAYDSRDSAVDAEDAAYADGEAHAFGLASDEVRRAEDKDDDD
jgi:hypothetical protein